MSRIFSRLRAFCLALASMLAVVSASANIDTLSANMFTNVLGNFTPGGVYQTQGQGIIAGPTYYQRVKSSNIQLFNLSMPHLKASCNGIDAWGGSFSFISEEQLVNWLRTVASQAIPYAFSLALDAICSGCEKQMKNLQGMMNLVNSFSKGSCDAVKDVFRTMGWDNDIKEGMRPVSNAFNSFLGATSDWFKSDRGSTQEPEAIQRTSFPATMNNREGNVTWRILSKSGLSDWWGTAFLGADKTDLQQVIMSVTGTFIMSMGSGQLPDGTTGDTIVPRPVPATINSINDFLNGGNVTVLVCDTTNEDGCLSPTPTNKSIRGFRTVVRSTLDSIIPKLTQVGSITTLTAGEISFLEHAPGAIGAQLVRLSTNPASLQTYASLVSDYIAVELTGQLVDEMLRAVEIAATGEKRDPTAADLIKKLQDKRMQVAMEFNAQFGRIASVEKTMTIANLIRATVSGKAGTDIAAALPR